MGGEAKTSAWVVVVTAVLSLIGVIATAYFGYLQVKEGRDKSQSPASVDRPATGRIASTSTLAPTRL
jgi:hypothetical protein